MLFPRPLQRGTLIQRYKRFLSDIRLDTGEVVTAHCANPGAMLGVAEPGSEVWLSHSNNPKRKLAWSWELVRVGNHLIGINTSNPNGLVAEALALHKIPELAGYEVHRREVRYGLNSRIDLLLESPGKPICYVEVKNVHLKRGPLAEFPDCVTARGAKHLVELAAMVREGHRAVMLYVVQRGDCQGFKPAEDLDPAYAAGLKLALAAGVEALCYDCHISLAGIEMARRLEVFA